MGESSRRRSKKRNSDRKERRSKRAAPRMPASEPTPTPTSPPSYSVEENSQGEWVNSRLNVKWPQQVDNYDVSKHRYLSKEEDNSSARSDSRRKRGERRRKSSKREKRGGGERKKRQEPKDLSSRSSRSESPYISLSSGPEMEEESDRSARTRRERKRMVVQTSPQRTSASHSGFLTDEDGKKIDSVVFDTRSAMMRYKRSDDILAPPPPRRSSRSKKKPSAADQRENAEYDRYYVGVRSRRSVEAKLARPGEFALYYEKPREGEVPLSIGLKIAYLSSSSEPFHFPIQCFEGADGVRNYVVMQNKSDGKMFTSMLSLVKHYSLYSHVDTSTGRLETFSIPH